MEEFGRDYPIKNSVTVSWGDMDALQHINNTVYFRYFEDVRLTFFEKIDLLAELKGTSLIPVLTATECRYYRPITYPDRLIVGTRAKTVTDEQVTMEYAVFSQTQQTITTRGEATIVMFDTQLKTKSHFPKALLAAIGHIGKSPASCA